jgi:hypothetical protein
MEGTGWAPVAEHTQANRLAFVVDVVSYGQRTQEEQDRIEDRLQALLRAVVADVGDDFDQVDRESGNGDGLVVLLPTGSDPTRQLPRLVRSVARRLAEDNRDAADRIRLRMAVGTGVVARNGFTGPLVVNISRLVDSEPLRRAVAGNPDADLVVLVLDVPHGDVVGPGHDPLVADCVERVELVDVALKEFEDRALLWVSTPQGW